MVLMMGVLNCRGFGRETRAALMAAVKEGRLGRLPKDGLKSELFFHPNSRWNAIAIREKEVQDAIRALQKVCCGPSGGNGDGFKIY